MTPRIKDATAESAESAEKQWGFSQSLGSFCSMRLSVFILAISRFRYLLSVLIRIVLPTLGPWVPESLGPWVLAR